MLERISVMKGLSTNESEIPHSGGLTVANSPARQFDSQQLNNKIIAELQRCIMKGGS